jgi:hypothetical protein
MRVGVVSDSAGDVAALTKAFRLLLEDLACERLFFLGGNWVDVDACQEATAESTLPTLFPGPGGAVEPDLGALLTAALSGKTAAEDATREDPLPLENVVRVAERGRGGPEDQKLIEMLGSVLCLMVHNKADLNKEDIANANVILHGNTSKPGLVQIGTRVFITPGKVSGGEEASVAVLNHQGTSLEVAFHDLTGRVLKTETVAMGGSTRFSMK